MAYIKFLTMLFIVYGFCYCAPSKEPTKLVVKVHLIGDNGYELWYVTDDNQIKAETGELVKRADGSQVFKVEGLFSYITDGKFVRVKYVADENGYRPTVTMQDISESSENTELSD